MPAKTPAPPRRPQPPKLAAAPSVPTRPFSEALARIAEPLRRSPPEGTRLLAAGKTGSGKTLLLRAVVDYMLAQGHARFAFIHDVKHADHTPYEGMEIATSAALSPAAITDRRVIFRGDFWKGIECPAEDCAAAAVRVSRGRVPVLLVLDELSEATSESDGGAGRAWRSPSAHWSLVKGRAICESFAAGIQDIFNTPRSVTGSLTAKALFFQESHAARYAADLLNLPPAHAVIVEKLPKLHFLLIADDGLPPAIYPVPIPTRPSAANANSATGELSSSAKD